MYRKMSLIIPVFIPHEGCPHACVFCNQHSISGRTGGPIDPDEVRAIVHTWLARCRRERERVQVGFYGGSFTALPIQRQGELLGAAEGFLAREEVHSLRISTRPDCIDPATVQRLREARVATVELGVQSLDDRVLRACGRGHTARHVREAVTCLREGGMEVGLQLMLGLPGQTFLSLMRTAREAAALKPDFVRIYPVLVLRGSRLERDYTENRYRPLTLSRAVAQSAWMKDFFLSRAIPVVRLGLQAGPELEKNLIAGPYHPSFGEMVDSRRMLRRTRRLLAAAPPGKVILEINGKDRSIFHGHRSANMERLTGLGLLDRFTLRTSATRPRGTISISAP
ncbi:MAG: radical SAM protein [Desulfobulbaceae bacterium]